jgi:hypothetical protein
MVEIKKHPTKKWEISIIELKNNGGKRFKLTRRLPNLSVAETKFFRSKKKAKKQFDDWLK